MQPENHEIPNSIKCCIYTFIRCQKINVLSISFFFILSFYYGYVRGQLPELLRTDLRIRVDWVANPDETKLQKTVNLLHAFNNRLYDATDGQWRIRKFHIYDVRGPIGMEDKGVGHFHEVWETSHDRYSGIGHADPKCHTCPPQEKARINSIALKRLNNPNYFHLGLDKFDNNPTDLNLYGGTMVMEFFHSWTGLLDEYLDKHKEEGGMCARDSTMQADSSTCIMYSTRRLTELCRPSTHSKNTYQQAAREMDCYTWLKEVFRVNGKGNLIIPAAVIPGPLTAPVANIEYHLGPPTTWKRDERILNQSSKRSPALAASGNTLHMVHIGSESNDIWYSKSLDAGNVWTGNKRIRDQRSKAAPALVVVGTSLYIVHLGDVDNTIWYSRSNDGGQNWQENKKIPGQTSKATPALAVIGNTIHMVHLGNTDNTIWYSRSNDGGEHWTTNVPIRGQKSKASPALAVVGTTLHMVHLGDFDNTIWHSISTDGGRNWSENKKVPGQKSKASPALTVVGNTLHMLHLGNSDNTIWHSHYDGEWHTNVKIIDQKSKATPAVAAIGNTLHMVHLGDSENNIWYSRGIHW